ncbi:MAG: winged helix-turn-helix transcriptional regulator [Candidatus Hydrothermarchaeaceae archaeon]
MNVLALPTRRDIYGVISGSPGLHFREILRETELGVGSLRYHLAVLEKNGIVVSREDGQYLRFFPAGLSEEEKELLGMLRQRSIRKILGYLLMNPAASHREVVRNVGLAPSTVSWYLKKLERLGLLKLDKSGKNTAYTVLKKDRLASVLAEFKESFLDEWVNNFIEIWG